MSEYRERFFDRGNNEEYIEKVLVNYDLRYEQFKSLAHDKIELKKGETLEDALISNGYKLIEK